MDENIGRNLKNLEQQKLKVFILFWENYDFLKI